MKKVIIDARLSGLQHAGIGRYTEMLIQHFGKSEIRPIKPNIQHYTLIEQLKMPMILNREKPDLVHFPHFNVPLLYNKPFIVTIHDLLWHEQVGFEATTQPKWKYLIKYLGYRLVMRHAVFKAKAIIVPSNWVKQQLVKRFPRAKDKVRVIYEGVSEIFMKPDKVKPFIQYGLLPLQFLIYVGSLYPHKNVSLILNVLKHLTDLKLVVVCSRNIFWEKFRQEVKKKCLEDRIILAGFVPDEKLACLYQNAIAFVFPSRSEGFGLPGLEAMACGCPVISSSAGSLPEIYGEAAVYFSPDDKEKLKEHIEKIRDNRDYREKLIKLGYKQVAKYSWEKCAKETMEVYARSASL